MFPLKLRRLGRFQNRLIGHTLSGCGYPFKVSQSSSQQNFAFAGELFARSNTGRKSVTVIIREAAKGKALQ